MLKVIILTAINMILLVTILQFAGIRFNVSDSYPLGIYKVSRGEIKKNDLVQSCVPDDAARLMLEREYVHNVGSCKGYPPVMKRVAAVEGDEIEIGEEIRINGVPVDNSMILELDEQGKKLVSATNTTIKEDHVWLLSTYTDISFDSRYYGQVPISMVKGRIEPLLVLSQ